MNGTSDEELISRARSGDSRAFEEFILRHSPGVFRWMARACGEADAEDLTQEVFLRAFRGLSRFRGEAPPRAWLASIAHNTIKNRYRFLHRFRRVFGRKPEPENAADPPAQGVSPEAAAAAGEVSARVAEALQSLPEEYRLPVVLRDLEGWNYEEIAVSLHVPVGTVKSRIARGRGQLRDLLAPLVGKSGNRK
jgi:RNA polymerase sigma-70 factor (ECF subfamily)